MQNKTRPLSRVFHFIFCFEAYGALKLQRRPQCFPRLPEKLRKGEAYILKLSLRSLMAILEMIAAASALVTLLDG